MVSLAEKPLTGEPDAGNPPVRFGGRSSTNTPSLPLSFAPDNSASGFGMNTNREELLVALLALLTSHERGLVASRSEEPTVAVGFIPRLGTPDAPRRGATHESGVVFSIVAPRRRISWRIEPWLESHGITKSLRDSGTAQGKNQIPVSS